VKVQVTQQHIDSGVRGSCTSDPIALALKDLGFIRPWVGISYIYVSGRNGGFMKECATLPPEAYEFLKHFDNGLPCGPLTLEIEF
jgi:hypothetical protein